MPKSKPMKKSRQDVPPDTSSDIAMSLDEWKTLKRPLLVLKAGQYGLPSKGTKEKLADNLYRHLHPDGSNHNDENVDPNAAVSSGNMVFEPIPQRLVTPAINGNTATAHPSQDLLLRPTTSNVGQANNVAGPSNQNQPHNDALNNQTVICEAIATLQQQQQLYAHQQQQYAQQTQTLQDSIQRLLQNQEL